VTTLLLINKLTVKLLEAYSKIKTQKPVLPVIIEVSNKSLPLSLVNIILFV
jgi:hypothetical protein